MKQKIANNEEVFSRYKPNFSPPCSHYEFGEGSDRVERIWIYVSGRVGGGVHSNKLGRKLTRLHDHKGDLFVVSWEPLTIGEQHVFREAWEMIGRELSENVEFVPPTSEHWNRIWNSRRFDRQLVQLVARS